MYPLLLVGKRQQRGLRLGNQQDVAGTFDMVAAKQHYVVKTSRLTPPFMPFDRHQNTTLTDTEG